MNRQEASKGLSRDMFYLLEPGLTTQQKVSGDKYDQVPNSVLSRCVGVGLCGKDTRQTVQRKFRGKISVGRLGRWSLWAIEDLINP